jgi:flagellar motor protein MotB
VKNLEVIEGKKGVCVIIPGVVIFKEGKTDLLAESTQFLARISFLVSELPYLVEIKGCASSIIPSPYRDPLEFSVKRALQVYNFFLTQEISPEKLKVSGYGDAFINSGVPQDKVEIIFKEAEL